MLIGYHKHAKYVYMEVCMKNTFKELFNNSSFNLEGVDLINESHVKQKKYGSIILAGTNESVDMVHYTLTDGKSYVMADNKLYDAKIFNEEKSIGDKIKALRKKMKKNGMSDTHEIAMDGKEPKIVKKKKKKSKKVKKNESLDAITLSIMFDTIEDRNEFVSISSDLDYTEYDELAFSTNERLVTIHDRLLTSDISCRVLDKDSIRLYKMGSWISTESQFNDNSGSYTNLVDRLVEWIQSNEVPVDELAEQMIVSEVLFDASLDPYDYYVDEMAKQVVDAGLYTIEEMVEASLSEEAIVNIVKDTIFQKSELMEAINNIKETPTLVNESVNKGDTIVTFIRREGYKLSKNIKLLKAFGKPKLVERNTNGGLEGDSLIFGLDGIMIKLGADFGGTIVVRFIRPMDGIIPLGMGQNNKDNIRLDRKNIKDFADFLDYDIDEFFSKSRTDESVIYGKGGVTSKEFSVSVFAAMVNGISSLDKEEFIMYFKNINMLESFINTIELNDVRLVGEFEYGESIPQKLMRGSNFTTPLLDIETGKLFVFTSSDRLNKFFSI